MRVLFYLGDKQWTATARAMLAAARGLAGRGHPITIACLAESRLEHLARDASLETVPITPAGSAAGGAWDLRKILQQRFIEVAVVTTERDHLIVGSAMRFAERGGVLRRIPPFEAMDAKRGGRMALKMAAAGLLLSTERELAELDAARWNIPAAVAPVGVDAAAYDAIEPVTRSEVAAPPRGLLIVCSYDPSGRYRMGTVFRTLAFVAPRHPNMHIVVVGPGSADDELRMHAAALGVGPVMTFLGARDDERRVMRAADAGWVVSSGDTGAFGCLDFMALRIPVIAERTLLTEHYIANGITGVLLTAGEPSTTASAVAAFLAGAEKRAAMGNAGRTRVQRDFPESALVDGFERAVNAAGDRTKWAHA